MTLENNETPEIDPFEAAFKELSDLENQTKDVSNNQKTETVSSQSEDKPEATATSDADGVQDSTSTETSSDGVADEASKEETVSEQDKPDPTAELINKFSEIIDRAAPQKQEPQVKETPQVQEPAPEIYSKDEEDFLKTYQTDWPDVVKGEALRRKQEYHQLLGYVFKEVADQIRPMMETLQTLAERTHYSDLTSQVEDYSNIRDKVVEWAGKQPTYLQTAYNHVIQHGTVDEVKDLVDRYRRDTGIVQTATTQIAPQQTKSTELPPATKQAVAALAPVQSKRSVVKSGGTDLNDFDGAFEAFSKLD